MNNKLNQIFKWIVKVYLLSNIHYFHSEVVANSYSEEVFVFDIQKDTKGSLSFFELP